MYVTYCEQMYALPSYKLTGILYIMYGINTKNSVIFYSIYKCYYKYTLCQMVY